MLKRKNNRKSISLIRAVISYTIFVISIATLLSVNLHIFLYSKVPVFSDPTAYKLPSLNAANQNGDIDKLWKAPQNKDFVPCADPSPEYSRKQPQFLFNTCSRGYLLVHTNGGLNQIRAGICDMVAVARVINATLIVPELDKRSFWQDTSNFSDVFDLNHFISALANDVQIIKKLIKELTTATRAVKHFRSWSGIEYYQDEIARMCEDYQIIRAAKSDSHLDNSNLPPDIQSLRCRTLYGALRFSPRIEAMGKLLVERMRSYGPYIALHLRYEKDMLSFSGCTHGLSLDEADEP
ncbi:hypothetical protein MKW98_017973 [Papaver atlanticum]|uniref:O-fucosyltransferase family protein n=1 Tax=Papaver atlanticum TaxID=357466 RepID=A0AAD4TC19_9MAGN|nr:hypothetical protein MKW98_017973 [Papaver atlanticum]